MRFVVHHHTGHPGEKDHYDLMIDAGDALATWRISTESMGRLLAGGMVGAAKIANHRREYLSYEGPVSCDRGMVKIMDAGECVPAGDSGETLRYWMEGKKLRGLLVISPRHGDRYDVSFSQGEGKG
jgi:hypothetical protein